jgi:hypothetical protein
MRERHFRWYAEYTRRFDGMMRWIRGVPWAERRPWLLRTVWEYPNLHAAWQWACMGDAVRARVGQQKWPPGCTGFLHERLSLRCW